MTKLTSYQSAMRKISRTMGRAIRGETPMPEIPGLYEYHFWRYQWRTARGWSWAKPALAELLSSLGTPEGDEAAAVVRAHDGANTAALQARYAAVHEAVEQQVAALLP